MHGSIYVLVGVAVSTPYAMPDVRFDFAAASDLASACRSAASRVDALHSSRVTWVSVATEDFSGYFATLFSDNASSEGVDAANLASCLRDVAAKVEALAQMAREENAARRRAREWQARQDRKSGLHRWWDEQWGLDERPVGTTGTPPTQTASSPALQQRQTPSQGDGSGGTSSANPDNLRSFATNCGGADDELDQQLANVRSADDVFQAGLGWGSLSAQSVWTGFAEYIRANRGDATWANTIAGAFEAAGGSGVVSTVSNAVLAEALRVAGVSESRQTVTIDPAEVQGMPPSSGFADDPVNVASGNFIEVEDDLSFIGGAATLGWSRVYNSASASCGAFGPGWSSLCESGIVFNEEGAHWYRPDGRLVVFSREGDGWSRSRGDSFWLESVPGESAGVRVVDAEGGTWRFNASGELAGFDRGPGTGVQLVRDGGRLTRLVHEVGRHVEVSWNSEGTRVVGVCAGDGRAVAYAYDDEGRLISARSTDRGDRTYEWDSSRSLVTVVRDADGVALVDNTYDEAGRISTQRSPHGRVSRYTYLPTGVTEVADEDGERANTWVSDRYGRLIAVVDSNGNRQQISYDRWGRPVMIRDRAGEITVSEYDERGRRIASLDPRGVRTSWVWDESDRLVQLTLNWPHALGPDEPDETTRSGTEAVTRFEYSGQDRDPSVVVDPMGGRTLLTWERGQLTSVVDPTGVRLDYTYDQHGDLVAVRDGVGATTVFERDEAGRVVEVRSPLGHSTRYEWDRFGHVICRTDPDGAQWRAEYSPAGRLLATVDPAGARTEIEYDSSGSDVATTDPLGRTLTKTWDDLGNLSGVRLPDGRTWSFTHDALSRLRTVTNPEGSVWAWDFDEVGRPIRAVDPLGQVTTSTWGADGSVTVGTDPHVAGSSDAPADDASPSTAGRNQGWSQVIGVDALGRPNKWGQDDDAQIVVRDLCGNITEVLDAEGSLTLIERDAAGRPMTITTPVGTTTFEYDTAGRPWRVETPEGVVSYEYDGDGRVLTRTAGTLTTRFEWDECARPIRVSTPGTSATTYTWDRCGRLVAMRDAAWGKRRFAYDASGALTSVTNALGGVTTFIYDDCARMSATIDPDGGTTHRTYTPADRVASVRDQLGRVTTAGYDAVGRQIWQEDPSGIRLSSRQVGGTTSLTLTAPDGTQTRVLEVDADRGTTTSVGEDGTRIVLVHDRLGRLIRHERDGEVIGQWEWDRRGNCTKYTRPGDCLTFMYRPNGDVAQVDGTSFGTVVYERDQSRTSVRADNLVQQWTRDDFGRTASYTVERDGQVARQDLLWDENGRLHSVNDDESTTTYTYDDAGQLASITSPAGRTEFTWDHCGRLIRTLTITEDGATQTVHTYDAAGQLTARTSGDRTWTYAYDNSGRRVSESGPDGVRSYVWGPTSRLQSVTTSGGDSLDLSFDALGLVSEVGGARVEWDLNTLTPTRVGKHDATFLPGIAIIDGEPVPAGHRPARHCAPAQPWSEAMHPLAGTPASVSAAGTLGVAGMEILGARAYDPATLSFLSTDPLEHSPNAPWTTNPYSYAANNPLAYLDPSGLKPLTDEDLAKYNSEHRSWWAKNWEYVAGGAMVVAGGVLMATGVGGPAGMILIGAGADSIIQKATTGSVNWGQVAVSGVLGAVGGGAGGALVSKFGLSGFKAAATVGATSGGFAGAGGSGVGYLSGPGPHTVSGFLGTTAVGTVSGGLIGGAGGAIGYKVAPFVQNLLGNKTPQPVLPDLPDDLAVTFSGARYTAGVLDADTVLYRAGSQSGSPLGQFFSSEPPVGVIQTRIDKAIPYVWPGGQPAPLDTGFAVKIPQGTVTYTGTVANQGGIFMGGTEQIVVVKPWEISGVEVVGSWPLR